MNCRRIDQCIKNKRKHILHIDVCRRPLKFGMAENHHRSGIIDLECMKLKSVRITRNAIRILGTYIGQNTCTSAIKIFKAGKIDTEYFFTETIPLEQGMQAFPKVGLDLQNRRSIPKKAMKIILRP